MRINVELDTHHPRKDGTCRVRLTFYDGTDLDRHKLDHVILPKNWDGARKRVRFGATNFNIFNASIDAEYARAEKIAIERPGIKAKDLKLAMAEKEPDGGTFYEVAVRDLENTPPKSWHTQRQRASAINRFNEWRPNIAAKDLTSVVMEDYMHHLEKRVSHNTATTQVRMLRTIYRRVCRRIKMVPVDILDNVDAVARYTERPSQLDSKEVAALMEYADAQTGWSAKAVHMWMFSFYGCGIRWGDLCKMKVEQVAGGRVRASQSKTDKGKNVVLHPYAEKVAKMYRRGDYVFGIAAATEPTNEQIVSACTMSNYALKKAAKACGITKRIHNHNSRHSFAGMALDASLDDRAIQAAMGIGDQAYKHYKGVIRPATVDEQVAVVWRGMVGG